MYDGLQSQDRRNEIIVIKAEEMVTIHRLNKIFIRKYETVVPWQFRRLAADDVEEQIYE